MAATSPSRRSISRPALWRPCQSRSRRRAWRARSRRRRLPTRHARPTDWYVTSTWRASEPTVTTRNRAARRTISEVGSPSRAASMAYPSSTGPATGASMATTSTTPRTSRRARSGRRYAASRPASERDEGRAMARATLPTRSRPAPRSFAAERAHPGEQASRRRATLCGCRPSSTRSTSWSRTSPRRPRSIDDSASTCPTGRCTCRPSSPACRSSSTTRRRRAGGTRPGERHPVHVAVLTFQVEERTEVDGIYSDLTSAGYEGRQPPFDAFFGARYAIVADPDGNDVAIMSAPDPERRVWPPDGESPAP